MLAIGPILATLASGSCLRAPPNPCVFCWPQPLPALALVGGTALGQTLESQRDAKQAELEQVRAQEGVLSTELARYSEQVDQLAGQVATLRNREAIVAEELAQTQARLETEADRLDALRERLGRSLKVLSKRLVEIYKSDQPDALTVILDSDGFDDLVNRYDYLDRIQDQDAGIVDRVRDLRDETEDLVGEIRDARDEIAAKKAELERTRMQLEAREAELAAVRDQKAAALDATRVKEDHLEKDLSHLNAQIQEQPSPTLRARPRPPTRFPPARSRARAAASSGP